jgi:hypothetical protein
LCRQTTKTNAISGKVAIRILGPNEGVELSFKVKEIVVYEAMLKAGLRLPIPPMVRELLVELNLAPIEIKPNGL